jgi:hypothetical protein
MAAPNPLRDLTPLPADGQPAWVEDWTDPQRWEGGWTGQQVVPTTNVDDGLMGSRWAHRKGVTEAPYQPSEPIAFRAFTDPRVSTLWKWRFRHGPLDTEEGSEYNWIGLGIALPSNALYNGITSGVYGYSSPNTRSTSVLDLELEWIPETRRLRARDAVAGGSFSAWTLLNIWNEDNLWAPPLFWHGSVRWPCDIGRVEIFGKPMWACSDIHGFARWVFNGNAGWHIGYDGGYQLTSNLAFGGLHYVANTGELVGVPGYAAAVPASTEWGPAYSPVIGRDVTAPWYEDLLFLAPQWDVGEGGYVRIHLRDAETNELLPDAWVPGNSTGIIGSSEVVIPEVGFAVGAPTAGGGLRRLSLSEIPEGTEFYIEVRGRTQDDPGGTLAAAGKMTRRWQPHIGSVGVTFATEQYPATTTTTTTTSTTTTTTTTTTPEPTTTTTTTTTAAPTTTTTTAAPVVQAALIGGQRFTVDPTGALRLVTSAGVVGVGLTDPDGHPVRLATSLGTKGLVS